MIDDKDLGRLLELDVLARNVGGTVTGWGQEMFKLAKKGVLDELLRVYIKQKKKCQYCDAEFFELHKPGCEALGYRVKL